MDRASVHAAPIRRRLRIRTNPRVRVRFTWIWSAMTNGTFRLLTNRHLNLHLLQPLQLDLPLGVTFFIVIL